MYSDVDLSNKLNELKTFNNPSLCYMGPGAGPPTPYEPTPYATTQLIQSSILNKAGAAGAAAGTPDIRCWNQPPSQLQKAHMQYNIMEQSNRLNKGERIGHSVAVVGGRVFGKLLLFVFICFIMCSLHICLTLSLSLCICCVFRPL